MSKIKAEYYGKVISKYDSILGEVRIEIDKVKPSQHNYLRAMGFGHIFETTKFVGIEEEKPKKTRTRKSKPQQEEEE
jgi:hypothetical protein